MAAGWLRSLAGDRVEVFSGGSEPADDVNQGVVAAMAEVGIDISGEVPQPGADEIVRAADVVVDDGLWTRPAGRSRVGRISSAPAGWQARGGARAWRLG